MSLWTRLTEPAAGEERISKNAFIGYLYLWVDGVSGYNKADLMATLDISTDASEEGQLDSLVTLYQAASDKARFLNRLERILDLGEHGVKVTTAGAAVALLTGL